MHRHELEDDVSLPSWNRVALEVGDDSLDEAVEKLCLRNAICLLDGLSDGVKLVDKRLGGAGKRNEPWLKLAFSGFKLSHPGV